MKLWGWRLPRKWKPLLTAAGGAGILAVGVGPACSTVTGNPLLPIQDTADAAQTTDAPIAPQIDIGNPLPPDVDMVDDVPDVDESDVQDSAAGALPGRPAIPTRRSIS